MSSAAREASLSADVYCRHRGRHELRRSCDSVLHPGDARRVRVRQARQAADLSSRGHRQQPAARHAQPADGRAAARLFGGRVRRAGRLARHSAMVDGLRVAMGRRVRRLRLLLLLEASLRPRVADHVGLAHRPSPERRVQPQHGAAPDRDRLRRFRVLHSAVSRGRSGCSGDHGRQPQSHLPVLGAHRAHPPARAARMDFRHALQPSRAPRAQSRVHRQELRRRLHSLGSPVRHVPGRARGRAVRLRHHHRAEELESAVGEPAFLERHGEARVAHAQLGRQVAHLVQAAGLVSGGPGSAARRSIRTIPSSIRRRAVTRVRTRSRSTGC